AKNNRPLASVFSVLIVIFWRISEKTEISETQFYPWKCRVLYMEGFTRCCTSTSLVKHGQRMDREYLILILVWRGTRKIRIRVNYGSKSFLGMLSVILNIFSENGRRLTVLRLV